MRRGECAVTYPDSKGPTQALGYMEFADRYGGELKLICSSRDDENAAIAKKPWFLQK